MSLPLLPTSNARYLALRLRPGEDVIPTLRKYVEQNNLQAAFIAGCVGSLTQVSLRFAGREDTQEMVGQAHFLSIGFHRIRLITDDSLNHLIGHIF